MLKTLGPPPATAEATLVMVHGRGACADSILSLHSQIAPHLAAVAPQARHQTWYPYSFLAPLEQNQPDLDESLATLARTIEDLDLPGERIALLGFSQGACLTLEFVARNPKRYKAVMALTGGLITLDHHGSLHGTPIFLGSSDPDPHVPFSRVQQTADVLTRMGAQVELRRYPGMPHTVHPDELAACRKLLES